MISIRSAISRSIIGGGRLPNSGAAFLQANIPAPSLLKDDDTTTATTTASLSSSHRSLATRQFSSPAYRRYLAKSGASSLVKKYGNMRGFKPSIGAIQSGIQEPNLAVARDMGKSFSEMENEPLQIIAEMGNHKARSEVLRRHIMSVDLVGYETACHTFDAIAKKNQEGMFLVTLPYKIGIFAALAGGVFAVPMVFEVGLAKWFNEAYVTMEVPPPSDLDTALETGAWTWNWMEPVLGTASFSLLAFQFARQQFLHLGIKPFTQKLIEIRCKRLCDAFPRYDEDLLHSFVESDEMVK